MKTALNSVIGAAAWVAFIAVTRPSPAAPAWAGLIVLFVVLVLVPLAAALLAERRDTGRIGHAMMWARRLHLPAGLALAVALGLHPGWLALLATLPWAVTTAFFASAGLGRMLRDGWSRPLDRLSTDVALVFLFIGALWLLAERAGLRPPGFDPAMIGQAAALFHVLGFAVSLLGGLVLRQEPDSRFAARGVVGVVLGAPALGVGMTATQLGWNHAIEAAAGCGLALGGLILAILHVRWALDRRTVRLAGRGGVLLCGIALFFAMVLLVAYSVRAYVLLFPSLTPPQLLAAYLTLGAVAGVCGLFGWRSYTAAGASG